jgi:lipopolysaccharide transport system ATP-binding protein
MNIIEFNNVWKKFKRGEELNSLRDAIPNLFRTLLLRSNKSPSPHRGEGNNLTTQEFWALQDVSFAVEKGEVVGIIGSNGAGKSTALKLLAGIINPNKGEVKISGRLSALIEVTAGFHPELTGRENVYLNGTILGMRKKEIDKKFDEIVEFSGIGEFIDTPVKRYSSGMFSRLGFSVASHMEPDILLVDEVLSVGDIAFQAKCSQKMRQLLHSGTTIVLVSHNPALIQSLCKRVILLNKGTILKVGTPEEVIPYYENIVYTQSEQGMRKELSSSDYKVSIKDETLVKISDVLIYDGTCKQKEIFDIGEPISVKIEFEARKRIDSPVFCLEIIRSDGVLCCSSSTKNGRLLLKRIEGKGAIKIDLGILNLAPGIYVAKFSIWDKDMLHPYAMRNKDVFRTCAYENNSFNEINRGIFIADFKWKV